MKRTMLLPFVFLTTGVAMLMTLSGCSPHTDPDPIDQVAALYSNTQVIPNIIYSKIDSVKLGLDVYVVDQHLGEPPWIKYSDDRKPVLLYLHGGGWTSGDKISRSLFLMPYISHGWCVVTADYRLLSQAGLPGIISDARASLNWIYDNADKYKFDTTKIIISGESAGGHLALMAGLLTNDSLFGEPGRKITRPMRVAGIINWFGVADLISAKDSSKWDPKFYKQVVGSCSNPDSLLRICSPVTYINASSPPVFTIHGDQDRAAHYSQAPLLQDKLNKAGVKNYLFTVKGKKHGNFDAREMTDIYVQIWKFMDEIGVHSPLPSGPQ
jgi:acetyl esterase/lipase